MKLSLDKYAYIKSPIHSWDHSSKLISLLALIFTFAFVNKLALLPAMVAVTATLFILSRLPFSFLLTRLRYPGWFITAVVIFLPLTMGDTIIFNLSWLSIKAEGCRAMVLIVTRFVCILTVSLVLFGTAPFLTSIKTMRFLGLPAVIVDMMLLTYRYLEQFGESLKKMQRAMRLRGFNSHGFNRRNFNMLANLAGSLLVRSYEQSQRVYQAMILRGYGYGDKKTPNRKVLINRTKGDKLSLIAFSLTMVIAASFLVGEIWL